MRLIDADEIYYDNLIRTGNKEHSLEWAASRYLIDTMPTIDAVPKKEAEKMRNEIHYWMEKCEKYERTILDLTVRESEHTDTVIRIMSDGFEIISKKADKVIRITSDGPEIIERRSADEES